MIKKVTMYTVVCDNCGKDAFKGDECIAWNDEDVAHELAGEKDWEQDDKKDYCPDCYFYNSDGELTIDENERAD
jgi:hypothetical protein